MPFPPGPARRAALSCLLVCALSPAPAAATDDGAPPDAERRIRFGVAVGYAQAFQNVRHPDGADATEPRMLVFSGQGYLQLAAWGRPRTIGDSALDLVLEPQLMVNFAPSTGVAGAMTGGFRYRFWRGARYEPHLIGVAGVGGMDFDLESQDDGFEFWLEAGLGVRRLLDARRALVLEARYHHISNAGTHPPNLGIDSVLLTAGLEF